MDIARTADQENRRLTTLRKDASQARTRLVNQLRHILRRHNLQWQMPTKKFPTKSGLVWMKQLALPEIDRLEMNHLLADLEQVQQRRKELEQVIAQRCGVSAEAVLLSSMPGVIYFTAIAACRAGARWRVRLARVGRSAVMGPTRAARTPFQAAGARDGLQREQVPVRFLHHDRALSRNAAATLAAATNTPPSAGPTARAMFMARPSRATAAGTDFRGDRLPGGSRQGRAEAQDGRHRQQQPRRHRPGESEGGEGRGREQDPDLTKSSSSRRSTMSARAPAGRTSKKNGTLAAAWTRATINAEVSSSVISQAAATFYT